MAVVESATDGVGVTVNECNKSRADGGGGLSSFTSVVYVGSGEGHAWLVKNQRSPCTTM